MQSRFTDGLLILLLLSLPVLGIVQACEGGDPTTPENGGPPEDNHAPDAVLKVVGPGEGATPFTVHLDGSSSNDPDGHSIEHLWLFSDGTAAIESVVQHEFTSSGRHSARLIVTDEWGLSDDAGPVAVTGWGLASSPWPKFAHDERNSGLSPNVGPMMDLEHANEGGAFPRYWRGELETGRVYSVCIGYDGVVIYCQGQWLRARTANGGTLWDKDLGSKITAWPAIAHDGSIIVGTEGGRVYRIDSDGQTLWTANLGNLLGAPITLRSAVNIDGDARVYLGGYFAESNIPLEERGRLIALSFDGAMLWSRVIPPNRYTPRLVPAITPSGNIVVNGSMGRMFTPDGTLVTTLEFQFGSSPDVQPLGPPSVSPDGMIAFTHGRLPVFEPDGAFYMELMGLLVDDRYPGSGYAGYEQAPVWAPNSVCQVQSISGSYYETNLTVRTLGGAAQTIPLKTSYIWGSSPYFAGATQDSAGRIYASCRGLHAISPISVSSMFPYVPRRFSLWTYERPAGYMTAPAIGEDGWLYVGYGNDILAIGD